MNTRSRHVRPAKFVALSLAAFAATIASGSSADSRSDTRDYADAELRASPAVKLQLSQLRAQKLPFQVGYTTVLDRKLGEITGGRNRALPLDQIQKQNESAQRLRAIDDKTRADFKKTNPKYRIDTDRFRFPPLLPAFDWRSSGKVTPVKNQANCGSCWDFASVAGLESSYLIQTNETIDASEQYVLSCSGAGGCGGGSWYGALDYLVRTGTASETNVPYTAMNGTCGVADTPYSAVAWGSLPATDYITTTADLKDALRDGPVITGVVATAAFQAYVSGVFNEPFTGGAVSSDAAGNRWLNANHAVLIVGFDDNKGAFVIKNSWGAGWGDSAGVGTGKGFMYLKYGSSNVGIGAAWVRAKNPLYKLPQEYFTELSRFKIPGPGPDPSPLRVDPRLNPGQLDPRINPGHFNPGQKVIPH